MRKRAGALILKDKKLLLVTGRDSEFYWTPGGRLEENETHLECLHRELEEELGVKVKSAKEYHDMEHDGIVEAKYFIVEIEGNLKPNNEVASVHWYSKDDFEKDAVKASPRITDQIFPLLIKDNLV